MTHIFFSSSSTFAEGLHLLKYKKVHHAFEHAQLCETLCSLPTPLHSQFEEQCSVTRYSSVVSSSKSSLATRGFHSRRRYVAPSPLLLTAPPPHSYLCRVQRVKSVKEDNAEKDVERAMPALPVSSGGTELSRLEDKIDRYQKSMEQVLGHVLRKGAKESSVDSLDDYEDTFRTPRNLTVPSHSRPSTSRNGSFDTEADTDDDAFSYNPFRSGEHPQASPPRQPKRSRILVKMTHDRDREGFTLPHYLQDENEDARSWLPDCTFRMVWDIIYTSFVIFDFFFYTTSLFTMYDGDFTMHMTPALYITKCVVSLFWLADMFVQVCFKKICLWVVLQSPEIISGGNHQMDVKRCGWGIPTVHPTTKANCHYSLCIAGQVSFSYHLITSSTYSVPPAKSVPTVS